MEALVRFKAGWSPSSAPLPHHHRRHHHHHHHHHHCHHHHHHPHQFCSHHSRHHHHHCNCRHPLLCAGLPPLAPQNTGPVGCYPSQKEWNLEANFRREPCVSPGDLVLADQGYDGFEEAEEEEEEDPVFVLTDEWREFFARSEARRRLEKQQAKRKDKC